MFLKLSNDVIRLIVKEAKRSSNMKNIHKGIILVFSLALVFFIFHQVRSSEIASGPYITNTTSAVIEKVKAGAAIHEIYAIVKNTEPINTGRRNQFLINEYEQTLTGELLQQVIQNDVYLYELPNTQAHLMTQIPINSLISSWSSSKEGWRYVQYNQFSGYIKAEMLQTLFSKHVTIQNPNGAAIYMEPGNKNKVMQIPASESVLAYALNEQWLFIATTQGNGYMQAEDLLTEKQVAKIAAQKEAARLEAKQKEAARIQAEKEAAEKAEAERKAAEAAALEREKQAAKEQEEKNASQTQSDGTKKIALTFDDGPTANVTPQVLATLKKYQVPATFFVIGKQVEQLPQIMQQIASDGHQIGGHSWSHKNLSKMMMDEVKADFLKTNAIIEQTTGIVPTIYRPPFGAMSDAMKADSSMRAILWNIDTLDWQHRNAKQTVAEVKKAMKPDGVVLMHDIHQSTADALEQVIQLLQQNGYTFVTIDELLQ